ncbi:MAG: hypothetical protein K2W78_02070 [Xanthobacteraceae bacterium]|nr:hypothetical protein [Xanthobacteraceae bacterium]
MPYALFVNDEQISKAYRTRQEVWKKADDAGLVVESIPEETNSTPARVLDEDYEIKPCPPDTPGGAAAQSSDQIDPAHTRHIANK